MGPNEDGVALFALDISIQRRSHGGLWCLALALDEPPLQGHLGNIPRGHEAPLQAKHVNCCALEDSAAAHRLALQPLSSSLGADANEAAGFVADWHAASLGQAIGVIGAPAAANKQ